MTSACRELSLARTSCVLRDKSETDSAEEYYSHSYKCVCSYTVTWSLYHTQAVLKNLMEML